MSKTSVIESVRSISFGAGTANHIKFGIIITKNNINPHASNPNLYFFTAPISLLVKPARVEILTTEFFRSKPVSHNTIRADELFTKR